MFNTGDRHSEITLSTANKPINEWEQYKKFIVNLTMFNSTVDYTNLLSRDGEYGRYVELTYISRLFSNYFFRVHYESSTNSVDLGTGSILCHLLFSGTYDAGNFDVSQENSHTLKQLILP